VKYVILEAASAAALQKEVQARLDKGWELQGGVAVATYAAGAWWYYQALVARDRTATADGERDWVE
jgi:hypothetical protein